MNQIDVVELYKVELRFLWYVKTQPTKRWKIKNRKTF